ncbi:hypothetical protein C8F01DRAFT_1167340 [Mycena amicta]|nr:hypothetical protein C8F01DRAFT_1167340 [Mycena amicta]
MKYHHCRPPFPQTTRSTDWRTKLALARVCKTWNRIGVELLYANPTLSTIGQLPALVETLEARSDLAALVRSLEVCYFMPPGCARTHYEELSKLIALCSGIIELSFSPLGIFNTNACRIPNVPLPSLTSLHFFRPSEYASMLPLLTQVCGTLLVASLVLPGPHIIADLPLLVFTQCCNY